MQWLAALEAGRSGPEIPVLCCYAPEFHFVGHAIEAECAFERGEARACEARYCPRFRDAARPYNQSGYLSIDGQDEWLYRSLFQHFDDAGYFLDMGGYAPVHASNSWFFERCLGWSGLVVEPQSSLLAEFAAHRTASLEEACVWSTEDEVTFASAEGESAGLGGVLVAPDDRRIRTMIDTIQPGARQKQWRTRCRTLRSILGERNIRHIRYFSLDCEGCELQAVLSIDFAEVVIDVFTIESWPNGRAAADFLVKERGYVHAGLIANTEHVLVRADLDLPRAVCDGPAVHPARLVRTANDFKPKKQRPLDQRRRPRRRRSTRAGLLRGGTGRGDADSPL